MINCGQGYFGLGRLQCKNESLSSYLYLLKLGIFFFFNEIRIVNAVCWLDTSVSPDLCRHFASSVTCFSSLKTTDDQMQTMSVEHMLLNNEINVQNARRTYQYAIVYVSMYMLVYFFRLRKRCFQSFLRHCQRDGGVN